MRDGIGRGYEAVIDLSTGTNGYVRSSLVDLNFKSSGNRVEILLLTFFMAVRGAGFGQKQSFNDLQNQERFSVFPALHLICVEALLGQVFPQRCYTFQQID